MSNVVLFIWWLVAMWVGGWCDGWSGGSTHVGGRPQGVAVAGTWFSDQRGLAFCAHLVYCCDILML